jgi:Immunity protein 50
MWTSVIENPEAIRSIFAEEPSLTSVRLMKFELSEDGPTANLSLALADYPSSPPSRWARVGANAVTLVLQLMGLSGVSLNGWGTENPVSCELRRQTSDECVITVQGATITLNAVCRAVRVAHVEGYKRIA